MTKSTNVLYIILDPYAISKTCLFGFIYVDQTESVMMSIATIAFGKDLGKMNNRIDENHS